MSYLGTPHLIIFNNMIVWSAHIPSTIYMYLFAINICNGTQLPYFTRDLQAKY